MQQRFCNCGHVIWVQYLFPNKDCRIIFRSTNNLNEKYLSICPYCGIQLKIDDLN